MNFGRDELRGGCYVVLFTCNFILTNRNKDYAAYTTTEVVVRMSLKCDGVISTDWTQWYTTAPLLCLRSVAKYVD
jgi:hypothetical protein